MPHVSQEHKNKPELELSHKISSLFFLFVEEMSGTRWGLLLL